MNDRYRIELPDAHIKAAINGVMTEMDELKEALQGDVSECKMIRAMMYHLGVVAALSMSDDVDHQLEKVEALKTLIGLGVLHFLNVTLLETKDDSGQDEA